MYGISAEIETFTTRVLTAYVTMCGWVLARAHAKAGEVEMIAGCLEPKKILIMPWYDVLFHTLTT